MDEYFNEDDLINDYINNDDDEEEYDQQLPPFDDDDDDGYNNAQQQQAINKNTTTSSGGLLVNGGDIANVHNNFGNDNNDAVLSQEINNDNNDNNVPVQSIQLTSTSSPGGKSTSSRVTNSPYNNNNDDDIYGFERYTGLSSWRTTTTTTTNGGNKGGATTMEATSWKKKQEHKSEDKTINSDYEDEDGLSLDSNDDLDQKKRDKVGVGGGGGGMDNNNNNLSYGLSNKGGEAQLVKFREKAELHILGRSWGIGRRGGSGSGYVYTNQNLPKLGEDSMPITLLDGTRTFVKRNYNNNNSTNVDEEEKQKMNIGEKEEEESNLLGLPISELIRRADILQKRAIQRKVEREARYGNSGSSKENDDGDEVEDETMEDAAANSNNEEEGVDTSPKKKKKKKVSFQQETINLTKKRQEHKDMQYQQRLWVDKHAPTSISHLLSDERTNREVLRALRGWDPYVFKKDAPTRPMPAYWQKSNNGDGNKGGGDWKSKKGKFGGKYNKHKDGGGEDGQQERNKQRNNDVRPDENNRVILLSGPPGVGKSTLAHIVCKHAGYRPIEVNASDERSKDALVERVTRAMESTTLDLANIMGSGGDSGGGKKGSSNGGSRKGGKPNCIILDEIDGADSKQGIAALVDIIRANIPPPNSAGGGKKGKGGGGSSVTYLRRPIILICNHKYAPALRPILPYARQFDVKPPNPERLTGRLRAVLAAEHMSVVAGGMLLHRLVAATGGDVRSCLYALQFASARARELAVKKREREGIQTGDSDTAIMVDISSTLMSALGDNGNGMKDIQSDVTSTVSTVFRKQKAGARTASQKNKRQKTGHKGVTTPKGVDVVLKAVDHFGDNSKALDCLFMNVNRVSYVDPTLDRCCSAFEWLSRADMYRSQKSNVAMNNSAEHQAMQKFYIPSAAAAIHLLCCVETRPDLTFSTRPLSDCHYQNQANVSLVHRFVDGLSPRSRRGMGGGTDTIVSDVIPYGLWLLSAGEGKHTLSRPVSSVDILSAEEKLAFSAHVATLRALGLTYVRDQGTFNSYPNTAEEENVRLEPEIDKLVKFEEMNDDRQDIPPLLKELLAHGASVAAMRERENESQIAQQEAARSVSGEKAKQEDTSDVLKVPEKLPTITPNKLPPTKAKAGNNSSAAKNFLGFRAAKAKKAKTAARAARSGFDRKKKVKLSNSGSGVEISKVIRFKYQKGFTQAVRAPCQIEDLL